ncbi:MAG: hypothetical protein JW927_19055 [Deltaproteobacteria bacterium]|nr:hypothetical protein [Deltaproteobacteria bacterium]
MGKFKTSWDLFRRSLSVMTQNKKLFVFIAIEVIFIVIIALLFISPFVLLNTGHALTDPSHWKILGEKFLRAVSDKDTISRTIRFAWFAGIYLFSMFSATFFNVAFYNEIIHALNGDKVSIARGFKAALSKIKLIMIWSLFAGIVGIIIKKLEEKLGIFGFWIMRLIGISWSLASIFIIPVIIREQKSSNPLKLLKTSAVMLKKTWGETVIGYLGIGSVFVIFFLVLLGIYLGLFFFALSISGAGGELTIISLIISFLLFFISMPIFGVLSSMAHHIYRCALYMYASEGVVPGPYSEDMMNRAWKVKEVKTN